MNDEFTVPHAGPALNWVFHCSERQAPVSLIACKSVAIGCGRARSSSSVWGATGAGLAITGASLF
ncbi:MAG: hypothetical protein ACRDN0_24840 [Trebonia sp.]